PNANIVFGGSGSNRTGSVTPGGNQVGSATRSITGSGGIASVSDTFVLTVNATNTPPTISDILNQSTPEDTAIGPIGFIIGDLETPAGSLQLSASSSNPTLVPNGNIGLGGAGSARTIAVTPA